MAHALKDKIKKEKEQTKKLKELALQLQASLD